jgi:hypothetical protein
LTKGEGHLLGLTRDAVYNREVRLADPHQVNSIIATAIWNCRKDHHEGSMDPEQAKQVAKCIVDALLSAGLQIIPADKK